MQQYDHMYSLCVSVAVYGCSVHINKIILEIRFCVNVDSLRVDSRDHTGSWFNRFGMHHLDNMVGR